MSMTVKKLLELAELAKLYLEVDDLAFSKITQDLNNILHLVEQLNDLDLHTIEPMFHFDGLAVQRLRPDIISEFNIREQLQEVAPTGSIESGLYLVPQVIEN